MLSVMAFITSPVCKQIFGQCSNGNEQMIDRGVHVLFENGSVAEFESRSWRVCTTDLLFESMVSIRHKINVWDQILI